MYFELNFIFRNRTTRGLLQKYARQVNDVSNGEWKSSPIKVVTFKVLLTYYSAEEKVKRVENIQMKGGGVNGKKNRQYEKEKR